MSMVEVLECRKVFSRVRVYSWNMSVIFNQHNNQYMVCVVETMSR